MVTRRRVSLSYRDSLNARHTPWLADVRCATEAEARAEYNRLVDELRQSVEIAEEGAR